MHCIKCNRDLARCECPDLEERLNEIMSFPSGLIGSEYAQQIREQAQKNKAKPKMESYQLRVIEEKADLDLKIARLSTFMASDKWRHLPTIERDRLSRQHLVMQEYSKILGERIHAFSF